MRDLEVIMQTLITVHTSSLNINATIDRRAYCTAVHGAHLHNTTREHTLHMRNDASVTMSIPKLHAFQTIAAVYRRRRHLGTCGEHGGAQMRASDASMTRCRSHASAQPARFSPVCAR